MELGAFSISLAVKDLEASRNFYEKFGFESSPIDAYHLFLKVSDILASFAPLLHSSAKNR